MEEAHSMIRARVGGAPGNWRLVVRRVLALLAGAVFVYAGILKASDPLQFANDLRNYHILPWSLGVRLAFYLPWLEILAGLALIFHRLFAGALVITGALMLAFIGALIWTKILGINVACGCFGAASSNLTFTWHLALNSSVLAVLIFLWVTREGVNPGRPAEDSRLTNNWNGPAAARPTIGQGTETPTLYVKRGCPYCKAATNYLDQHQISYHSIEVRGDPAALQELQNISGHTKTPTLVWNGEGLADFGTEELAGFISAHRPA